MSFLKKDPKDKIKQRFLLKTEVFKRNRLDKSNQARTIVDECQLRLMFPTLVSEKDLIHLVHGRENYIWMPRLAGANRTIVYSSNQFTRSLDPKMSFKSMLPNGSYASKCKGAGCVLDTFFVNDEFWVLDVLLWNDCLLFDCEAEFRSHWLSTCLEKDTFVVALANEYSIRLLPRVDGKDEKWVDIMKDWINNENFDGIIVYQKTSYYLSGQTSNLVHQIPKNFWKLCEF